VRKEFVLEFKHPSKDIVGSKGDELKGKKIALCITGSVAAAQSPKIARELMRYGAEVYPVFSPMAQKIIHPNLMEWATGNKPILEMDGRIDFISLAESPNRVDLVLIAPATANTIAKLTSGINDTPVTAVTIAAHGSGIPVLIAPAMHKSLYDYPATQENIRKLESWGYEFIQPRIEEGKAKFAEVEEIVKTVISKFTEKTMVGLKVLVTAGPTYEYIDPIRVITNKSSGKMGIAIAEEAKKKGADVTLVYGPGTEKPPGNIKTVMVETGKDMFNAVISELKKDFYNILIAAGAVADFTPENVFSQKISTDKISELVLTLKPTKKIIEEAKKVSPKTFVVGFKAEYNLSDEELINRAYERLIKSGVDLMVANDVGRKNVGFRCETNEVFIVDKDKNVTKVSLAEKNIVARKILDFILSSKMNKT
jgi:phosphopantothenoylcysteine decarboxylase/phosphopantothenate--cysteine ligase